MVDRRINLNLSAFDGLPQNEQFAFINYIKGGYGFGSSIPRFVTALGFNSNGIPTVTPTSQVNAMGLPVPPSSTYNGAYVLQFQGTGALRIGMDVAGFTVSVGNSFVTSSTSGGNVDIVGTNPRVVFTPTGATLGLWILQWLTGQTYSGMGPPQLCRLGDEAAMLAGELFHPDFITFHRALNLRCLRFMHWDSIDSNLNWVSQPYTYQMPSNYMSFAGQYYPLSLLSPSDITSSDGGTTYVCSAAPATSGSITAGEMIYGWITTTNLANATLNVGGRGPKPIYDGSFTLASIGAGQLAANQYVCFTYDPILDAYMGVSSSMFQSTPLSVKVALCNELNCDGWFNFPIATLNSEAQAMAQYIAVNLNSNLTAHFEWSNETWGGTGLGSGISQKWANTLFTNPGPPFPGLGVGSTLGWKLQQIHSAVTTGWTSTGRPMSTLDRTAMWAAFDTIMNDGTFMGVYIPSGQGFDSYKSSPGWAYNVIDSSGMAPYFEGPSTPAFQGGYVATGQEALYTAADNYASGDPALMAAALLWVDGDLRSGTGGNGDVATLNYTINTRYALYESDAAAQDATRASFGLAPFKINNYEGGLQIQWPSATTLNNLGLNGALYGDVTGRIALLFIAYLNSALNKQLVLDYISNFYSSSFPHAGMQAWFESEGAGYVTSSNTWSMTPAGLYSTPFQQYNAIQQWDGTLSTISTNSYYALNF